MIPKATVNADKLISGFKQMIDLQQNYTPFFQSIIGIEEDAREWTLRGSINKAFMTKSSQFEGLTQGSWPSLSPRYIIEKAKKYSGAPTLVASGDMFNSLVRTNKFSLIVPEPKRLMFGTLSPYAKFHLTGTKAMPPRPFMGFTKVQKKTFQTLLAKYVSAAIKGKQEAARVLKGGK